MTVSAVPRLLLAMQRRLAQAGGKFYSGWSGRCTARAEGAFGNAGNAACHGTATASLLLLLDDMKPRRLGSVAAALAVASLLAAPTLADDSRTGSAGTGAAGQGGTGSGLPPQIDDMMPPTHRPEQFGGTDTEKTEHSNDGSHRGTAGDNPAQPSDESGS
jgi:hypothetical protein